ncbi:5-(carboxyamino)imidazole ribonucleotide synthase [Cysteiniphilum halobium]|uniref:5-(carboxyamino)imidazole ribonucleotide synthase n=1 Tax=Cysteiniphilum halobium TaxID=2219059 RepID=UPI000E6589D7|nr:5-(carboxyamino)imidazole ribonucleotide synthase [Cysteiniphilum halobium]
MKIAILGNGQLAQMLIESAEDLDVSIDTYPLPVIDRYGKSTPEEINLWQEKLQHYDVVTYESENISVNLLQAVSQKTRIFPAIKVLSVAQDRLLEKDNFKQLEINTNNYMRVDSFSELQKAAKLLSLPFIIKTRRFGYDGKGQYVIKTSECLEKAWEALGEYSLIAESFVPFDYEVSQIASRDQFGHIAFYPLVRNEHRDGILRETHVLIKRNELCLDAQEAVKHLLEYFDYVGTFAVEFFVKNNQLFANEMAPRVHNSGHWSINGANVSQFENHMRAISGESVVDIKTLAQHILMINLIAEDVPDIQLPVNSYAKSYGKSLRAGRKMGHINIVDNELETFINSVKMIYQNIKAKPCLEEF